MELEIQDFNHCLKAEGKFFCFRWKWTDIASAFYRDSAVVRESGWSVCRGYFQNVLLPGSTDVRGRCLVTFGEEQHVLESYQVLTDASSMARLEWTKWNIFTKLPFGSVAYTEQDTYVTRFWEEDARRYRFGDLNPRRGLTGDVAVFLANGTLKYMTEAEVLVEIEPVKYELDDIDFVMRRARVRKEQVELGQKRLTYVFPEEEEKDYADDNDGAWGTVRAVIAYNASTSYYWGQLPGLIKAVPASAANLAEAKKVHFKWGLPLASERQRILEVSANMLPGTSVDARASAVRTFTEVPYSAKLVAVYADGQRKKRLVNGTYVEQQLAEVSTEYGAPFFTHNGTLSPTTTTTTTSTTSTSTPAVTSAEPEATTTTAPMPSTTLRPRRTTEPTPTVMNPLLRFYPSLSESEATEGSGENPNDAEMQSDEAASGGAKRSPFTHNGGAAVAPTRGQAALCASIATFAVMRVRIR